MNSSHSNVTDWGLSHVRIEPGLTILDVGCGGGKTIQKLAALATEGVVHGIDYANGSVAGSRAQNAKLIDAGRVDIQQSTVSQLPFADDKFDLVTAIETQYYWPNLDDDMREIRRVLKPGGTLLVIAECYNGGINSLPQIPVMKLLRSSVLSPDQLRQLFSSAGYANVQVDEELKKGWICVRGEKPF